MLLWFEKIFKQWLLNIVLHDNNSFYSVKGLLKGNTILWEITSLGRISGLLIRYCTASDRGLTGSSGLVVSWINHKALFFLQLFGFINSYNCALVHFGVLEIAIYKTTRSKCLEDNHLPFFFLYASSAPSYWYEMVCNTRVNMFLFKKCMEI